MDKALAAELERQQTPKDSNAGSEGSSVEQRYWRVEPTRRGLTEEARLVYSQGWTEGYLVAWSTCSFHECLL